MTEEEIRVKFEKRKYRAILHDNVLMEKRCVEEAEDAIEHLLTELDKREAEKRELVEFIEEIRDRDNAESSEYNAGLENTCVEILHRIDRKSK